MSVSTDKPNIDWRAVRKAALAFRFPEPRYRRRTVSLVLDRRQEKDGEFAWLEPAIAFSEPSMAYECKDRRSDRASNHDTPTSRHDFSYVRDVELVEAVERCRNLRRFPEFDCSVCGMEVRYIGRARYCPGCGREICNA